MTSAAGSTAYQKAAALARRLGIRRFWRKHPPSNLLTRDASPEALEQDVAYGFECGKLYAYRLKLLGVPVEGATVLEIGPGIAFGGMAYLAAYGARAAVADRWLAPWQADYHREYYRALARRIEHENDGGDPAVVFALAEGGYENGPLALLKEAAEALASVADETYDVIFSNAVLEHLADPRAALVELSRVTKKGGYGVHQVDFRDHRDFSRPLEHLLLEPRAFVRFNQAAHHEYGSQLRERDYMEMLAAAGFAVVDYQVNDRADDGYLDSFMPRLRCAAASPYQDHSREALTNLGGLFFVRRSECAA